MRQHDQDTAVYTARQTTGSDGPAAEEEGGDNRVRRTHNDLCNGGALRALSLYCTPFSFLLYKGKRTERMQERSSEQSCKDEDSEFVQQKT